MDRRKREVKVSLTLVTGMQSREEGWRKGGREGGREGGDLLVVGDEMQLKLPHFHLAFHLVVKRRENVRGKENTRINQDRGERADLYGSLNTTSIITLTHTGTFLPLPSLPPSLPSYPYLLPIRVLPPRGQQSKIWIRTKDVNTTVVIEGDGEVVALGGEAPGPLVDSVVGEDGTALREEGGREGGCSQS